MQRIQTPKHEKVNAAEKKSILQDEDVYIGFEVEVEMNPEVTDYPGDEAGSGPADMDFIDFYTGMTLKEDYFEDMYVEVSYKNPRGIVQYITDPEFINTLEKINGNEVDWEREAEDFFGWEGPQVKSFIFGAESILQPHSFGLRFGVDLNNTTGGDASTFENCLVTFMDRFTSEKSFPYAYHLAKNEWIEIDDDYLYSERDLREILDEIDERFNEYRYEMAEFNDDPATYEFERFIEYLERSVVGDDIKVLENYSDHRDMDEWATKPDGSLTHGFELISPPLPITEGIPLIKQIFESIESTSWLYTSHTTGFHVGISINGVQLKYELDVLKLALLVEEGKVYKYFEGRENNRYAMSVLKRLRKTPSIGALKGKKKDEYQEISNELTDIIGLKGFGKYHGVNFNKLNDNYIEFRYIGGKDYSDKFTKVKAQILDFAFFLKAAVDPEMRKQDYIKKLNRLIAELEPEEETQDKNIPEWLERASFINAEYEADSDGFVRWKKGDWLNGEFVKGIWEKGEWHSGTFSGTAWKNGTFMHGFFKGTVWQDGTFEAGFFQGNVWEKGVWVGGTFSMGTWIDGEWIAGRWQSGHIRSKKFGENVFSRVNPKKFQAIEQEVDSIEELENRARERD